MYKTDKMYLYLTETVNDSKVLISLIKCMTFLFFYTKFIIYSIIENIYFVSTLNTKSNFSCLCIFYIAQVFLNVILLNHINNFCFIIDDVHIFLIFI